jgi:hypothetical protein
MVKEVRTNYNEELFEKLKKIRDAIAEKEGVNIKVFNVIYELV